MVNAPPMIFLPLLAGKYGNLTKQSTQRRHQANEGKRSSEAEWVQSLGASCSWQSKKKHAAEKRWEMHILSKEEKEKWIEDYVERESAGARKRVEDAEAAVQQEQEDMNDAQNARLTNREPEKSFQEMIVSIRDCSSHIASSDDDEDGEDEDDEETE